MNARAWIKLGGLGATGLVIAAVLAALALRLVSQPIGLSSEPVTAGDRLVPRDSRTGTSGTSSATATAGASEAVANPPERGDTPSREEDAGDEGHDDHGGEEDHDD